MWFGDLGGLGAGLEGHEYAPGGSGGSLTSHTPPWRHHPTQIQTQTQKQTQTQTHVQNTSSGIVSTNNSRGSW